MNDDKGILSEGKEMALKLDDPNDFPVDAFRALLQSSPEQQKLIRRYMERNDETQSVVRSMFAILENRDVAEEDRQRAIATIADALSLKPEEEPGNQRFEPAKIERHLDSQEANFSQRLRNILEQKNIKQEELAERTGCTQSAISKMLARNSRPHKQTIFKMAAALGVSPTDLWPDLEVAAILDSIADFPQDRDLTEAQAAALDAALARQPSRVRVRDLPSRKGK